MESRNHQPELVRQLRAAWDAARWRKRRPPSDPVGIDAAELREGMRLQLRWTDAAHRFGECNLPVFDPPPS